MTSEPGAVQKRRRTPAEIEEIVDRFAGSGLNRSQFCRREGLTLGTLNRYLARMRAETSASPPASGGLVAVELGAMKPGSERDGGSGLSVVLSGGRRIEVGATFDGRALQRLVQVLETL